MRAARALGAIAIVLLAARTPRLTDGLGAAPVERTPLTIIRGTVSRNATLASILAPQIAPTGVQRLVDAARPVYDLARISIGHPFGLALGPDGLVAAFTYGIDELRTLRVIRRGDSLAAEILTRSYDTRRAVVSGTIRTSLFDAVTGAGEADQLALDLADIFAWDVDFNTEIQPGDSFRVAVEKLYLDGRFSGYGRILSAEFVRGERVLRAIRFETVRGAGYYAPDGTPLRRAFLRSPLQYSRITSRFSYARFHPILHRTTPHLGIDYAAPLGTPVLASADGVVTLAGWTDGFGNTIHLRHANGFQTLYGHLSRIQVRQGQRVSQGQVIGAVGSTGLSTGPHLDYRMVRDGVLVNPLGIQLPPAEPIPQDERAAFETVRNGALALLASRPREAAVPAVASLPPGAPPHALRR